ncbi:MAG: ABC transporter ATP-binding protein [Patescibacteria group bacterium]|jgi:lipopolysaccharide transport system ATP-binding protein
MLPIIKIEKLSKEYKIGQRETYYSLRDSVSDLLTFKHRKPHNTFWALKDVSFEVKAGEAIGIIGRNGAGKSTLLKILSQITPPTKGRVVMNGRVASLLEVGTGFHPELTGRENIYLNGAILGMSRKEIKKKFDEIVEFAEIEKFLDTPVKRYSSGMYVRLAFAVAAHLEPEILVIDEVLAVGDVQFQRKCLDKMNEIARKDERTVLFVSHNMGAIQTLCGRCVLLEHGKIVASGETPGVVEKYLKNFNNTQLSDRRDRIGKGNIKLTSVTFENAKGEEVASFVSGEDAIIRIYYEATNPKQDLSQVAIGIGLDDSIGQRIAGLSNIGDNSFPEIIKGKGSFVCKVKDLPLNSGRFYLSLILRHDGDIMDWIQQAAYFDVENLNNVNHGASLSRSDGAFLINYSWEANR